MDVTSNSPRLTAMYCITWANFTHQLNYFHTAQNPKATVFSKSALLLINISKPKPLLLLGCLTFCPIAEFFLFWPLEWRTSELICICIVKLNVLILHTEHLNTIKQIFLPDMLGMQQRLIMFSQKNKRKEKFKLARNFLWLSDTLELVFFTSSSVLGEPIKNKMNDIAFPHCTHNNSSQAIWFYGLIWECEK